MYIVAIVARHPGRAREGRVLERKSWFVLDSHDSRENEGANENEAGAGSADISN